MFRFDTDGPVSFVDNKLALMQALDRCGWPLRERDITLLEEELELGNKYLQQSRDLQKVGKNANTKSDDEDAYEDAASAISSARDYEVSGFRASLLSAAKEENGEENGRSSSSSSSDDDDNGDGDKEKEEEENGVGDKEEKSSVHSHSSKKSGSSRSSHKSGSSNKSGSVHSHKAGSIRSNGSRTSGKALSLHGSVNSHSSQKFIPYGI